MQLLIFSVFAAGAIIFSLIMITNNRSVVSAMSMVGTMFCLAALYVLLDAHLLAALQIIVYAGTIMVLFLFVIMLLNLREKEGVGAVAEHNIFFQFGGILIIGYLFIKVVGAIRESLPSGTVSVGRDFGTVSAVGKVLFTDYLLPFEVASILLLAAVVGAVILARNIKRKDA